MSTKEMESKKSVRARVGVDIGGTFTDVVLLQSDGSMAMRKVLSTTDDYGQGIITGLSELFDELVWSPDMIDGVVHGTTVATTAILEGKGARAALITTKGFRDVLELRRIRIPELYNLFYEKPAPLVPRRLRFEVEERMGPGGEIRLPLNMASLEAVVEKIRAADVKAVAICLLHSYANPEHERRVGDFVRRAFPDQFVTCSIDILPEIREYERTSTAVINAYVGPIVQKYIASLLRQLESINVSAPLRIMQSSGSVMAAESAMQMPAHIVESGPAAGVVGAAKLAELAGYPNIITLDMGGTTAKASMIENAKAIQTTEYEVGGGINLSSQLVKGGGYALKLPVIDLSEIGAGGGSIAWVDEDGLPQVGPQSAGATPGPVCYDTGGQEPTITDAHVVLGYINPHSIAGGRIRLNRDKAKQVLQEKVAAKIQKPLLETAYGLHVIAATKMVRAVKAVSTYRGRDPREFVLLACGGNGPVCAVEMASSLQMNRVLVPPAPGLFSAFGLLFANPEYDFVETHLRGTHQVNLSELNDAYARLEDQARLLLVQDGHSPERVKIRRYADLRYSGQAYELKVPVAKGQLDESNVAEMVEGFQEEHLKTYGHRATDEPVDLVNLRVTGQVNSGEQQTYDPSAVIGADGGQQADSLTQRRAYFGPEHGLVDTPVLVNRQDLAGRQVPGPLIIEEYDATCVIPPGCTVSLDKWSDIVIDLVYDGLPRPSEASGSSMTGLEGHRTYLPDARPTKTLSPVKTIDPVTFEVIRNALDSIADQTAIALMRSAYSGIVRDSVDYSTALCDRQGRMLAQGLTTPLHLGSFPDAMQQLIQQYDGRIYPGDIFTLNDPYGSGGMHLPDIYAIKPIFFDGRVEGFAATVAHHTDVGGISPGSNSIHSTEIYQEGLCIPLLKLYERGEPNETLFSIIKKNVRVPDKVLGDIRAQVAACNIGEKGFLQLLAKHEVGTLHVYLEEILNYAEQVMRAQIAALPDGEYEFVDFIDGLGENPEPIKFQVKLTIDGDEAIVDWTGTSGQVKGGINAPVPFTRSASYLGIRSVIGRDLPNSEGYMRPIKVVAPIGTIVNPRPPAPCSARGITGFRMLDTLWGALAQAIPGRVPAAGEGGASIPSIGGYQDGKPFVYVETLLGTWGGRPNRDGTEGISHPGANQSNIPIEMTEAEHPLEVRHYGFVTDSGGPGKHRGGLALAREYRLLADEAVLTVRSDRREHLPYGMDGGKPGSPSQNVLNPGPQARILPVLPMQAVSLKAGDVFRHVLASGGGYGNPLERDPHNVLEDVLDEKLTIQSARDEYGVIIDPKSMSLDPGATERLREKTKNDELSDDG